MGGIAVLAVGRVLAALASTMLHNNVIGIVGACCSVASLLAVHLLPAAPGDDRR